MHLERAGRAQSGWLSPAAAPALTLSPFPGSWTPGQPWDAFAGWVTGADPINGHLSGLSTDVGPVFMVQAEMLALSLPCAQGTLLGAGSIFPHRLCLQPGFSLTDHFLEF